MCLHFTSLHIGLTTLRGGIVKSIYVPNVGNMQYATGERKKKKQKYKQKPIILRKREEKRNRRGKVDKRS